MSFKTISAKVMMGGLIILTLTATVAGVGIWATTRLGGEIDAGVNNATLVQAAMEADMMHDALRADVLAALLAMNPQSSIAIGDVEKDVKEHAGVFRESLEKMKSLEASPEVSKAIAEIDSPLSAYITSAETIAAAARTDPAGAWTQLPSFMNAFTVLEGGMGSLSDKIGASAEEGASQAKKDGANLQLLMGGLLAGALVVAGLIMWLARRIIVTPINAMTRTMEKLAAGDHANAAAGANRQDEIGAMARAVNIFRDNALALESANEEKVRLAGQTEADRRRNEAEQRVIAEQQQLVVDELANALMRLSDGDLGSRINAAFPDAYVALRDNFNVAMSQLETAITSVQAGARGMKDGASEIASAANNLSGRTEQQAASLEETAAALDEITATVRTTATGANQAHSVVAEARTEAEKSGEVVREAVGAMGQIEESSRQISQIIGVIDEIAFQTNLLALNAGVEAARAGEAGRGFAVVASEVRALAQRSAEAAKEIKTLISASSQQVARGVDLVGRTGTALDGIVAKVAEISDLIREINASAQEQATALGQVNTAVNQMDQMTQQNAAMVEESTAASVTLAREADELAGLVAQFRTKSSGAAPSSRGSSSSAAPAGATRPVRAMKPTSQVAADEDSWEEF